ncbi:hypothetical protein GN958_ATG16052 [Phytophthora infestans]|uniref:Uncharacterized protein n=1 Tax=Phytophthora infestans TaxID=4787 RepID=A0A8S9U1J1_PHYIN|nr:hypothetical protein GN958_ATG16052 [Phytophthora infestans]
MAEATLSDIIEFLEVLDDDAGLLKPEPDAVAKHRPVKKPAASKPARKRKHKPGYSTELLHRRKAEARELSRQIPILEEWLERIRRPRTNGEGRQLQTQEQNHHVKLGKDLSTVIQDQSALSERGFVFASIPTARTALSRADNSHALVELLAQSVPQLYSLSETVFSNKNMPSFGCSMEPGVDEPRGKTIKLVARAPVKNSMKKVSDVMWRDINSLSNLPDKSYRYMNKRGAHAVVKSFNLTIRCPSGTTAAHGLQYLHKFEENDRIVHVRLSKLLLPTEGLQLCGHAWTVTSKATAQECEVRFFFQLFVERQEGFSAEKTSSSSKKTC